MINFKIIARPYSKIQHSICNGDFVDGSTLSAAVAEFNGQAMPLDVMEYLQSYFTGSVKKSRGRKPIGTGMERQIETLQTRMFYNGFLRRLQDRKRRYGGVVGLGRKRIDQPFDHVPLHEIAARMTARCVGTNPDAWRTLYNRIRSR
ncbi:hypothetical protein [Bauldia litoralis]|uniref:hypothetical protein n=1 Tax=Bauldia litoralis TaxID=665467 RepID=UPI0032668622